MNTRLIKINNLEAQSEDIDLAASILKNGGLVVIPTETVPQGMAVMIAFNPDGEVDEITKEMKDAARRLEFEQAAYLRDRIKQLRENK